MSWPGPTGPVGPPGGCDAPTLFVSIAAREVMQGDRILLPPTRAEVPGQVETVLLVERSPRDGGSGSYVLIHTESDTQELPANASVAVRTQA